MPLAAMNAPALSVLGADRIGGGLDDLTDDRDEKAHVQNHTPVAPSRQTMRLHTNRQTVRAKHKEGNQ